MNAAARAIEEATISGGEQLLRMALHESIRLGREAGELQPPPDPVGSSNPTTRKTAMDGNPIDPQEFGELRAHVMQLLEENRNTRATLITMSKDLQAMRVQMAEAKGGWKILVGLGGSASLLGSGLTWLWAHWPRG